LCLHFTQFCGCEKYLEVPLRDSANSSSSKKTYHLHTLQHTHPGRFVLSSPQVLLNPSKFQKACIRLTQQDGEQSHY
ncbi:hypothetical protein ABR965_20540, partial [Photorhabdus laumondii]|uniref:hypothetical protein n=1 Tax=Photorhabdus laumondii TaxID=2218628 RepID=UPI003315074F